MYVHKQLKYDLIRAYVTLMVWYAQNVLTLPFAGPWLFFNGKLLHLKLLEAENGASLLELCDGQVRKKQGNLTLRSLMESDLHFFQASPVA